MNLDGLVPNAEYTFEYKDPFYGRGRQVGVMADEIEEIFPDAVSTDVDGFKIVDYDKVYGRAA